MPQFLDKVITASSAPAEEGINSFKPESWTEGYVRGNVDGRKKTILRADPVEVELLIFFRVYFSVQFVV